MALSVSRSSSAARPSATAAHLRGVGPPLFRRGRRRRCGGPVPGEVLGGAQEAVLTAAAQPLLAAAAQPALARPRVTPLARTYQATFARAAPDALARPRILELA